ncbi:MAG TPA: TIGR02587 family membrane protein [Allosphingosinicella sp.]
MRTHPTLDTSNRAYAIGLARAFAGALLFALPLLMTMEMWALGFSAHPARLLLFLLVNFLILVGLSRFGGFERTANLFEDLLDALAACAVAIVAAALILALFGILTPQMKLDEIIGKIAIQSIPCSFGAMLARKQLSGGERAADAIQAERTAGYFGQLFLMVAGALFLAFNVAPTEEMILIGFMMSPVQALLLVLLSILLLDAFVYGLGFAGEGERPQGVGRESLFLRFTVVGYGIALLVSLYVLWTFGRADGGGLGQVAITAAVLAFPAAIGAAIARLVV